MLPKRQRLSRAEIDSLQVGGLRIPSTLFSIIYKSSEKPSVAVVISKKTHKSSVGRHALKRKIMLVLQKSGLPKAQMILYVQKKAVDATKKEVALEYQKCKEIIEKMVE